MSGALVVVCCLLSAVSRLLSVVCCLLRDERCLVFVVCCFLFGVWYMRMFAVC